MTELMPRVRPNPPPPALMRLVNPLVRRVLTTRLFASRIGTIVLVEFRGRRTGRLLRIPMGLHDIGGVPTAFTGRRWQLNFTGAAPVTVTERGTPRPGTAVLVAAAPGQIGAALRTALDNGAPPFVLGLRVDKRHKASAAELDVTGLSMIQFDFPETETPMSKTESR